MARVPNRSVLIATAVVLSLASGVAATAPVVEPNAPGITWMMCEEPGNGVKFRQPEGTTDLIISCTKTATNLTLKGCVGPHVKRDRATGKYSVTCDKLVPQ